MTEVRSIKARPTHRQQQSTAELGFADILFVGHPNEDVRLFPASWGLDIRRDLYRMSQMDETVGAIMWCIYSVLSQVEWKHQPCVDGKDNDTDAEAIRQADFYNSLLGDMSHTMSEHVEEALSMVIFGHAPCEVVLKRRDGVASRFNDQMYGISKIPLRDQMSITNWLYQGNDAIAFQQSTYRGSATIPLWKTCNYRTTSRLDRPLGRSLLTNALRVWKLKEKIQDSEAIGIERDLCGLPTFRIPQEVLDDANDVDSAGAATPKAESARRMIAGAISAVKDLRFNKSGGLIMPSDTFFSETSDAANTGDRTPKWDFKLITTAGQRSIDTRTAIRDYDRAIARVVMMQFLHLGDRSTGSYAMSDDQSSMAVRSLMALAMKVAMEWNKKAVPLVGQVNAFDPKYLPRMRASEISKDGIQQIGALMAGLGRVENLWASDVDMRMAISKLVNLPANREAQDAAAGSAAAQAKMDATAPKATFGAKPGIPQAANKAVHEVYPDEDPD